MKKVLLILCMLLAGCQSSSSYEQISSAKAMELMENENNYIILDVRTCDEYNSGHIKGAICIPNETINETNAYVFEQLPDKDQMILVYCRSGNRSKQASEKLVNLGYTHIIEFGGINEWKGEIE